MTATAVITGVGLAVVGLRTTADLLKPYQRHLDGFDSTAGPRGHRMRHRDRASRLAAHAATAALADAGLLGPDGGFIGSQPRTATVVSSNLGNLDSICSFIATIDEEDATALKPTDLPKTSSNATAGWLAIDHGLRGPSLTLSNGPTSGLDAVHWARRLILAGRADAAVVTGVEPDNVQVRKFLTECGEKPWPDTAASVVVESSQCALARGGTPRVAVGTYLRANDSAAAARGGCTVGLRRVLAEHGLVPDTPVLDIARWAGRQSGALGVLQCAAATAELSDSDGAVLAVSATLPSTSGASLVFNSVAR